MQMGARVAKSVDAADLKSAAFYRAYGFDSRPGHHACRRLAEPKMYGLRIRQFPRSKAT